MTRCPMTPGSSHTTHDSADRVAFDRVALERVAFERAVNDAGHPPQPDATTTLWQRFSVPYAFPVSFTRDLFAADNEMLLATLERHEPAGRPGQHGRQRLLMFIDAGVVAGMPTLLGRIAAWCAQRADRLEPVAAPLVVQAGEAIKNDWAALDPMHRAIHEHAIDRHSWVVAIGGGALLDAAGLVAATAHRGVRHVRVPTTVLSQNDSGVGVKNGINHYGQKNWLGTFAPPDAVINDSAFLTCLPERDRRAGMAEAVKVALIRDAGFFAWLEEHVTALAAFDAEAVAVSIRRCAVLHMHQIGTAGDPFERGSARPLDFGHWAAHRLETLSGHALRHGEAVAIGIALDTRCSVLRGLLPPGEDARVVRLLQALGFTLWHHALDRRDAAGGHLLCSGLEDFRIHLGGELTITLLERIGRGVEVHELPDSTVLAAIDWLRGCTA